MTKRSLWAISLSFWVATACGSTGGGGGLNAVCNSSDGVYVAIIDQLFECNGWLEVFLGSRPTTAELSTLCNDSFQPYLDDGTVTIDSSRIADCRTYVNGLTCADATFGVANPCDEVFVGTQQIGDDCDDNIQCAGDAYCEGGPNLCGACAARVANGQPCSSDDACVSRYCDGTDNLCGQRAAINAPCDSSADCGGNNVCDNSRCHLAFVDGDTCNDAQGCGWPLSGLYCDTTGGRCAPHLAVGDGCTTFTECYILRGETCDAGGTDRCLAATVVGLNQPCNLGQGIVCSAGLLCVGGMNAVCEAPSEIGDGCVDTCTGLFQTCVNDACQYGNHTGMCPAP